MNIFFIYLILINLLTFVVYGLDKYKAKKQLWRIPETQLLLLAIIGGSVGAFLGMYIWHHKTKHLKFKLGVPVIFLLQLLLFICFPGLLFSF